MVRALEGQVLDQELAWQAHLRLRLAVPNLGAVAPGQALLAAQAGVRDPLLPRVLLVSSQDVGAQVLECIVAPDAERMGHATAGWRPGDQVRVAGPIGRPFAIDRRTRRALLLGSGAGAGPLLHLARTLVAQGAETTFLSWPDADGAAMPGSELPPEVEYVLASPPPTAGDALPHQLDGLVSWADQLFVATAPHLLHQILTVVRRRLLRLRRGFAQALLASDVLPCGVGACDLCAIRARDGYRRLCRDGLVFDLLTLA